MSPFRKFINLKLRKIVLIFGGILLASGLSSDFKAASWDFCQRSKSFRVFGILFMKKEEVF